MEETKKEEYVRICLRCNSTDVSPDFSPEVIAFGGLHRWRCNRCGFFGDSVFFPEVLVDEIPKPKNLKEIKKDHPIENTIDSRELRDLGGRRTQGLWKCYGPIGILISLIFYFAYRQPYNILGIIYGLPIMSYFTLYEYGKKYFEKYKILESIGVIISLYAFLGPLLYLMLFFSSK